MVCPKSLNQLSHGKHDFPSHFLFGLAILFHLRQNLRIKRINDDAGVEKDHRSSFFNSSQLAVNLIGLLSSAASTSALDLRGGIGTLCRRTSLVPTFCGTK